MGTKTLFCPLSALQMEAVHSSTIVVRYLPNNTTSHPRTPQPQYSQFQPINNYDSHTGAPSGRPIYILLMPWVSRSRSSNTAVQQEDGRGGHW